MTKTETTSNRFVRIDVRCPNSMGDNILIVERTCKRIKCKCCNKWHSLKVLKQLDTTAFAPTLMQKFYEGAVMITELTKYYVPDWGRFE